MTRATTTVELEPQGAALVPLPALRAGRGRAGGAVSAGLREGGGRPAGRPRTPANRPWASTSMPAWTNVAGSRSLSLALKFLSITCMTWVEVFPVVVVDVVISCCP